jgi:hypothetical protein
VTIARADVVVGGAQGVGLVRRFLLGSVETGALNRSPLAVLVVRSPVTRVRRAFDLLTVAGERPVG